MEKSESFGPGMTRKSSLENFKSKEFHFNNYLQILGLKIKDISGKKILDVGADADEFAESCKEKKINTKIYSIDRSLEAHPSTDKFLRTEKYLKADALAIPFKDNIFDLVISVYAVPIMQRAAAIEKETIEKSIKEMLRVVRSGGQLIFAPVLSHPTFYDNQKNKIADNSILSKRSPYDFFEERVDAMLNELSNNGYLFTKETIEQQNNEIKPGIFCVQYEYRICIIKP